ncbi:MULTISPECIES: hypothetical protein [Dickeya]|nr:MULTISPECIES: hypothetical protein [Dickeya]
MSNHTRLLSLLYANARVVRLAGYSRILPLLNPQPGHSAGW